MLERLIKRVLDQAVLDLKTTPARFRAFFKKQNRLTDAEVDKLLADFEAKAPEVLLHYPRAEGNFPLYSIVMTKEREVKEGMFLGDFGGLLTSDEAECYGDPGLESTEQLSSMFLREYQITSYSLHPDTCISMYELCKYYMFRERPTFNAEGVMRVQMSGSDMHPLAVDEHGPDHLFRRQLSIQAIEMYEILGDLLPPIRAIDGAHFGEGSTEPPPGVKTNVTVFDPSEEDEE